MQCELLLILLLLFFVAVFLIFVIMYGGAKLCRISASVIRTAIIAITVITAAIIAGVVIVGVDAKKSINGKTTDTVTINANVRLDSVNISNSTTIKSDTARR